MAGFAVVGLCFLSLIKFAFARDIYNVVDYQAVGDGITDDTQVSHLSLQTLNKLEIKFVI
jgi:polygalacturonase